MNDDRQFHTAVETAMFRLLCETDDHRSSGMLTEIFQRQYEQELLQQASEIVKPKVRENTWLAYQLYAVEQLAAADVASRLQIPIADVYVAKSRITRLLRNEIKRLDQ